MVAARKSQFCRNLLIIVPQLEPYMPMLVVMRGRLSPIDDAAGFPARHTRRSPPAGFAVHGTPLPIDPHLSGHRFVGGRFFVHSQPKLL